MIFNENFLFLHIPKTAGMSLSSALINSLKGSVVYSVPQGHGGKFKSGGNLSIVDGIRHEDLYQARNFFSIYKGPQRSLDDFKMIFIVIRNPYDLEVSRYHYLRLGYAWSKGVAQTLALAGDFSEYVKNSTTFFKLENYILIDGMLPPNLRVLRFETFSREIDITIGEFLAKPLELKHENKTKRASYREYIDEDLEPYIYIKYKFLFDYGFYSRLL